MQSVTKVFFLKEFYIDILNKYFMYMKGQEKNIRAKLVLLKHKATYLCLS